ncbi:MAG: beta-propeller fold lactonase family protein, partial [Undibacterium sp.]|nr:beta-propeller fold lactonase family protein [Undibacterium sp.]
MQAKISLKNIVTSCALFLLTACGSNAFAPKYEVSVSVSGLSGSGLVLQNRGGDNLAFSENGTKKFTTAWRKGEAYAVTVLTEPSTPYQHCVVSNGSGSFAEKDVTNVSVLCRNTQRYLYVANGGENTLSTYSIEASSGALNLFGSSLTTGATPSALTMDANGKFVYVLNSANQSISLFSINQRSGSLEAGIGAVTATGHSPNAIALE